MLDVNGDGQASRDEWQRFFEFADRDDDSLLSIEELTESLKDALRPDPEPAAAADN